MKITVGSFVLVNPKWLDACGYEHMFNAPFEVKHIKDFGEGRKIYTLTSPHMTREWEVWEIRGLQQVAWEN